MLPTYLFSRHLIIDFLLLDQVSDEECLVEMNVPVSGVVLTLLSNLRLCFLQSVDGLENTICDSTAMGIGNIIDPAINQSNYEQTSVGAISQYGTSLQIVLAGIIEYIMRSSK